MNNKETIGEFVDYLKLLLSDLEKIDKNAKILNISCYNLKNSGWIIEIKF